DNGQLFGAEFMHKPFGERPILLGQGRLYPRYIGEVRFRNLGCYRAPEDDRKTVPVEKRGSSQGDRAVVMADGGDQLRIVDELQSCGDTHARVSAIVHYNAFYLVRIASFVRFANCKEKGIARAESGIGTPAADWT